MKSPMEYFTEIRRLGVALILAGKRKAIGAFLDSVNALQKLCVLVFHYMFATSGKYKKGEVVFLHAMRAYKWG
jgi:hypothetical protein